MNLFTRAIQIYSDHGYCIHTGLNPYHISDSSRIGHLSAPFTCVATSNGCKLSTGGGIAPIEVYLLQSLSEVIAPSNIFIIGNAFGWSTLLLALAFPHAKVIAIDAGIEGENNMAGIELTNSISQELKLNCVVEYGFSPQNTEEVIKRHFGSIPLDLVFIDGLHTNEQLLLDFDGIAPFCKPSTIFLYHDVINWKLQNTFNKIAVKLGDTHVTQLLHRTTSGIGVSYPKQSAPEVVRLFDAFTESKAYVQECTRRGKLYWKLLAMIAAPLPRSLKRRIKEVIFQQRETRQLDTELQ